MRRIVLSRLWEDGAPRRLGSSSRFTVGGQLGHAEKRGEVGGWYPCIVGRVVLAIILSRHIWASYGSWVHFSTRSGHAEARSSAGWDGECP